MILGVHILTLCSRCNKRCEKKERTDQDFRELVLREKCLLRKLANKEQEIQDYIAQLSALRNSIQSKSISSLKCSLQDPAVNLLIQRLRQDLSATKTRLEETQSELNAWKFTPDSNTGKRLMAKCRLLYQENEELGKVVNSGRIAKLEGELALQKNFGEEVKKSQLELDEFLQDLDEDVEGMQSTIYFLQNELKRCKELVQNTESKESNSKTIVNGIKSDSDSTIIINTLPISKTETPTLLEESKLESKPSKPDKSKDPKNANINKSNQLKVKKSRSLLAEGTDQSGKINKTHKSKHKSDCSKSEEKRNKSEKRTHSKGEVVHKKSKNDRPKSTDVKTPISTVNGLPNGS
ncbi:pre-mRNA-splicing regulator female-lethal(2)D-like isoform X2 [Sipha flava]|uniref:Pre-mRNA-splicing regulator female-lethal(2)D-like isoform X2 n=1 Tax=Sipha flava TaxID=143950 RepID=A0A8B8GEI9_9HEMI|nr:pre-mRNA-splicing regulator female-lethal(2)D-like isoform X2 [Sipha flava]